MKAKEYYHVAVYLRLSRDDFSAGNKNSTGRYRTESNSISSQRDMICSFIKKQGNMEIYDFYIDDGWSGTNFDRPGFQRMMEDIQAGHVDCVIVKDLSRLGRDYIEAGRLIQKTFPAFFVRFIALTDRYDSLTADDNETSLVVPVKNFVNDSYARDISGKVRSHQKIKRENGEFIGAFAVYGYKKSGENKNLLVPDDYAANIVRRIFAWKIEGYSNFAIAKLLDGMGILPPMEYKKLRGEKFRTGFVTHVTAKWSAVAVKRILVNENYTGTLVQGKEEKVSYKVKKSVEKPREEWTKVQGAHEAIITKEDFGIVQELLQTDTRAGKGEKKAHIYAGILRCGDCGEPMVRRTNRSEGKKRISFICSTKNKGKGCMRHTILEEELNELVLAELRQQIALFMDKDRVLARMEQMAAGSGETASFYEEIKQLHNERDKYRSLETELYADAKKGIITEEDYKNFRTIFQQRYEALSRAVFLQEETAGLPARPEVSAEARLERIKAVMQAAKPDRIALVTFVRRVHVYEGKRVCVELGYKDIFSGTPVSSESQNHEGQHAGEEAL